MPHELNGCQPQTSIAMKTIAESAATVRPEALTNTRVALKAPCALASAIRVSQLSKCYQIYDRPQDRLKQTIIPRLQRLVSPFFRSGEGRVYFREFWALQDVSFDVKPGETLGILGRNGAGKSTLLQIIAGTLTPTSGGVEVNGRVAALLELGSGFNPEFTGRENVYLNAAILGLTREETDAKFEEIAAFADIGDFIEQPIKTYSSGMMVRLAFAVQTAVEPSVLIVDEALAVGDARFQRKCYNRLERFRTGGGTVLFVTHDTGIIVQICSRALILESGRVLEEGEPHHIAKAYHRLLFDTPKKASASALSQVAATDGTPDAEECATEAKITFGEDKENYGLLNFVQPAVGMEVFKERELRYGSRDIEIVEISIRDLAGVPTTILEIHQEYEFYFRARYNSKLTERAASGFIISNTKGVEVFGTNGFLHHSFLPPKEAGAIFDCCMRIPVIIAPGTYFLTVAIASTNTGGGDIYYDCRWDALEFSVIGSPRCLATSIVSLDAQLSWRELCDEDSGGNAQT